jgi:hypothetical protein
MTTSASNRIAVISRVGDSALEPVHAFLEQLGLQGLPTAEPTGTTHSAAAERLESVRGANYAVVITTAVQLEAAVFDAGFLLGALGRQKVAVLLMGQKTPSAAWEGVPRVPMDEAGVWHLLLAREMRRAGLDVDLNRAI